MSEIESVRYVGDPDFHDGHIVRVIDESDTLSVVVQGYSGRFYTVVFSGVEGVDARNPEGMTLYALSESQAPAHRRRFVFNNWDDDDPAALVILARQYRVVERSAPEM